MTTIACWFNNESEHKSIWVCGDSKVSTSQSAATLIESSPKIFSLPIRCFAPGTSGFFDLPVFSGAIGLAYAGNSLVGLTLNSALSTCLARLNTLKDAPALDDVATFAAKMLQMYVEQLGLAAGESALCEVAIAGFCPIEKKYRIYHLSPAIESARLKYRLDIYADSTPDDFVLLLGADKERIAERIRQFRQHDKDISWWRAPEKVIASEVKNPQHPTIGGHVQLGICLAQDFQVYSVCQPGPVFLSYLGLNVSLGFGSVGTTWIGMPGMAI